MPELPADEFASAAERYLQRHLLGLQQGDPALAPSPVLARRVNRTLRWQAIAIVPMSTAACMVVGMAAGLQALLPGGGS